MKHIIYHGNALEVLKKMPSESVDMVMTSPPYWALRDYGEQTATIWDGDPSCEHEWGQTNKTIVDITPSTKSKLCGGKGVNPKLKNLTKKNNISISSFCSKCGAWKGQLGLEPTFDLYIKHLCDIFDEVKRVLKKTGTLWVNLGDTYNSQGTNMKRNWDGRKKNFDKGKPMLVDNTLPSKSLVGIPFRFAIEMLNRGWILRNTIIWHKRNPMPSSAKDRFTVDFEYIFFFSKSKKYYFEQQLEPFLSSEIEIKRQRKEEGEYTKPYAQNKKSFGGVGFGAQGRNKRCVWTINTKSFPEAHFAVYPPELCETPIKAGCPEFVCNKCGKPREKIYEIIGETKYPPIGGIKQTEGNKNPTYSGNTTKLIKRVKGYTDCGCNAGFHAGVVLDVFAGAGTTMIVAEKLKRNSIGIELNPEYIEIIKRRFAKEFSLNQVDLNGNKIIELEVRE